MSDKSWELRLYECLNFLNNFCFHVYAQNRLSHFLTLTLSHSHTLSISHSITLDMLNKFCFHLYAQKSLFIAENCNGFFLAHHHHHSTLSPDIWVHRAGSQLKKKSMRDIFFPKMIKRVIFFPNLRFAHTWSLSTPGKWQSKPSNIG